MNNFILKARFYTLGSAIALLPFSIAFCHLFLLLFMIACLCEGNFSERRKAIAQNPLTWLLPAFFLLHVIGVTYSDNISNGWSVVDKKLMFFLAPLVIASAIPFEKEEIKKLMWVFVGACLVGTFLCISGLHLTTFMEWNLGPEEPYRNLHPGASEFWPYVSYIYLADGIGMHPTYLSLYLLVCVLIVLRTVTNKYVSAAIVIYMIVFIVFVSSRIVVLATLVTLIFGMPKKKLLIAGAVLMIGAIILNPIALYRNAEEYTAANFSLPPAPMSDNPITIRMSLLWLSAKAVGEVNPVFGTGTGDVEETISILADKYNAHNILTTSDPHNQYIHTYLALGAIGLLVLLAVFTVPLLMLFQKREFWLCAGLLAFMAVCLTESVLERQKGIVLFSLFVGLTGNQLREFHFTFQRLKYA